MNRPLRSSEENPGKNQNQTIYRNQINKIANAVKELILGLKNFDGRHKVNLNEVTSAPKARTLTAVPVTNFWQKLKRRNIVKVAVVYAIGGWVIMQVAATVFPPLNIPTWTLTFIIILVLLGFPIALILAWAYEVSPDSKIQKNSFKENFSSNNRKNPLTRSLVISFLVAIAAASVIYFKFYHQVIGENKSIAVLPFVNMSNDPAQDYFSDGITDEILNALTHIKGLKVSSRTSAFQFKGKNPDLREVGKKLGVSTVLEGSVQKEGDRFRITAQLINVEDDYHILSEKYDVSYTKSGDIFVIQDKIANAIAERLSLSFGDQESKRVNRVPTESKEAHDWYLKGRFFWNQRNPDALKKGIEFFEFIQSLITKKIYHRIS